MGTQLCAAGEAVITRARRAAAIRVRELPTKEVARMLKRSLEQGIPAFLANYFEVTAQSSPKEFEHAATKHRALST
jgi:hypothetical protein